MTLCADKTGKDVNAPSHKPEPRYGDANVGKCEKQICVRDDAP